MQQTQKRARRVKLKSEANDPKKIHHTQIMRRDQAGAVRAARECSKGKVQTGEVQCVILRGGVARAPNGVRFPYEARPSSCRFVLFVMLLRAIGPSPLTASAGNQYLEGRMRAAKKQAKRARKSARGGIGTGKRVVAGKARKRTTVHPIPKPRAQPATKSGKFAPKGTAAPAKPKGAVAALQRGTVPARKAAGGRPGGQLKSKSVARRKSTGGRSTSSAAPGSTPGARTGERAANRPAPQTRASSRIPSGRDPSVKPARIDAAEELTASAPQVSATPGSETAAPSSERSAGAGAEASTDVRPALPVPIASFNI
jgi:hypothetical protein